MRSSEERSVSLPAAVSEDTMVVIYFFTLPFFLLLARF